MVEELKSDAVKVREPLRQMDIGYGVFFGMWAFALSFGVIGLIIYALTR